MNYYKNIRTDLISPIKHCNNLKILEIGCAECNTLVYLKERGIANYVVGVEVLALKSGLQLSSLVDELYITDFEENSSLSLPKDFDYIICGDVLEHMKDPWNVMKRLRGLLKNGGQIIFSVPNIRFFKAFFKIYIRGSFLYEESGIFDKTHLRFFCKQDALLLATQAGFNPVQNFSDLDIGPTLSKKWSKIRILNYLTFKIFKEFLAFQIIVLAKK